MKFIFGIGCFFELFFFGLTNVKVFYLLFQKVKYIVLEENLSISQFLLLLPKYANNKINKID
jgi:hypothetical protein